MIVTFSIVFGAAAGVLDYLFLSRAVAARAERRGLMIALALLVPVIALAAAAALLYRLGTAMVWAIAAGGAAMAAALVIAAFCRFCAGGGKK